MQWYNITIIIFVLCVVVGTAYMAINSENLDELDLIFVPMTHPRWSEPPQEDTITREKKIITIPYFKTP